MTVALITSMVQPGRGVKFSRKTKSWSEEVWELYERVTGKERPERFRSSEPEQARAPRNDTPPS